MSGKKNALETVLELIKELPVSSQVAAAAALGTGGTLLMTGNISAGLLRVYNEVAEHRWFWEDHVTLGLAKLNKLGLLKNTETFSPALSMLESGAMRYTKRGDWYSNYPLTTTSTSDTLEKPRKILNSNPLIYVALGDSAAQGVGVEDVKQSYVALFASYLRRATQRRIILLNLSISGSVASTVINTQLPQLNSLGITPDIITLDIGGNDTFSPEGHSVEDFSQQIRIITEQLPIPSLIAEVPPAKPLPHDKRAIALNKVLSQHVNDSPHILVPVRRLGEVPFWKTLSIRAEDGFHPNVDTYRLTALEFARSAEPLLKSRGWWQPTADKLQID